MGVAVDSVFQDYVIPNCRDLESTKAFGPQLSEGRLQVVRVVILVEGVSSSSKKPISILTPMDVDLMKSEPCKFSTEVLDRPKKIHWKLLARESGKLASNSVVSGVAVTGNKHQMEASMDGTSEEGGPRKPDRFENSISNLTTMAAMQSRRSP